MLTAQEFIKLLADTWADGEEVPGQLIHQQSTPSQFLSVWAPRFTLIHEHGNWRIQKLD